MSRSCPSGKRRHDTAESAIRSAIGCSRRGRPLRTYPCPDCHGWHLTHKPHAGRLAMDLARRYGHDPADWQHALDRLSRHPKKGLLILLLADPTIGPARVDEALELLPGIEADLADRTDRAG